jgi:peptidoglycan/LPS O-acetylase OafA/YrhL
VPVLGAVALIGAGPGAWFNRVVLSNRVMVWFGLISYPLYLWHWPLLTFARIMEGEVPARLIRVAAVVLSVVLAWLTYRLLERPVRAVGRGRLKVVVLVVLMAVVGYTGYNAYQRDGLALRLKHMRQVAELFSRPDSGEQST